MIEQSKAVLLDAQLVATINQSLYLLNPVRQSNKPLPEGQILYRRSSAPKNKSIWSTPTYTQVRSVKLNLEALSFIKGQKKADVSISGVDYRDVGSMRKALKEAGLKKKNLKSFFRQKEGKDNITKKEKIIRGRIKKYQSVEYYSDNEKDAFALARHFRTRPQVQFYLVQNKPEGTIYSRKEAEIFPNLHRIVSLSEKKNPVDA
jgi:hypothetical protein